MRHGRAPGGGPAAARPAVEDERPIAGVARPVDLPTEGEHTGDDGEAQSTALEATTPEPPASE